MKSKFLTAAAGFALTTWAASAQVVTNPGFETGDTTGWTVGNAAAPSGFTGINGFTTATGFGNNGSQYYYSFTDNSTGGVQPNYASLSQAVTVPATGAYAVSVFVENDPGSGNSDLMVSFGGKQAFHLTASSTQFGWTQFTGAVSGVPAGPETLLIQGKSDGGVSVDDISVSAVPEAPGQAIVAGALAAAALAWRLRRR